MKEARFSSLNLCLSLDLFEPRAPVHTVVAGISFVLRVFLIARFCAIILPALGARVYRVGYVDRRAGRQGVHSTRRIINTADHNHGW